MAIIEQPRKLTYFHIPKTGGRFLSANTIDIFKHDLINKKISTADKIGKSRHQSFYYLENNESIKPMVSIRNPIDRTISHYLYILQNTLSGDIKKDKIKFLNYITSEKCLIENYQSKFICSNIKKLDLVDEDIYNSNIDNNLIYNRLSKVSYLIKTESINKNLCNRILLDCYKDYNINPNFWLINQVFTKKYFINPESSILKNSLNNSEIKFIENIVKKDMEIYETSKYFLDVLV